jgi:hypothetical protein
MWGFGSLSLSQQQLFVVVVVEGRHETRDEKGEKESEGGGYEVAVIPRNTALCSERKMPLADRS